MVRCIRTSINMDEKVITLANARVKRLIKSVVTLAQVPLLLCLEAAVI